MNRPLEIRDVVNISLEASGDNSHMYPQLVAQFTCQYEAIGDCIELQYQYVCCSVVWMINVTHAAIVGMSVTVTTPNVSGVVLQQCSHLHIQSITERNNDNNSFVSNECGIVVYESSDIEMDSLTASNFSNGMWLYKSRNTSMLNVSAAYNGYDGIHLYNSTDTNITNVSAAQNGNHGIRLYYSNNTRMANVSTAHNGYNGIRLYYSTNTRMTNVSTAHNGYNGIRLYYSTNTRIMNVSEIYSGVVGITLINSTDTSMTNVYVAHTEGRAGISLINSTDTSMTNVSATHSRMVGIFLYICTDTNMMNVSAVHNQRSGIAMINTANTYITNTTSLIKAYNTINIVLNDTSFSNMDAPSTASHTSQPMDLSAVITLYNSTLFIRDSRFTSNSISSIKAIRSNVTMSGKVLFHNNTASSGTCLIFEKNSLLIIKEYSNIHFQNNHAINYGGVFKITTEELYETSMSLQDILVQFQISSVITSRTECFVHVEGSRSHTQLTFINNTAGRGGDVLYGGLVALGYDGDWNCLLSFKNISDMSQQSGLSRISSAPSRVCLCNETGQPDCLTVADPTTRVIYPGQTITIPVVVVGQDFGTVNGSVFAHFLNTTDSVHMQQTQDNNIIAVEHSQCSNLEYTIFSQSEESAAMLVLTQDNREISHLMNEGDNKEITNTWEILKKEANYKTLAHDIICDFINFTRDIGGNLQFTIKYNESNLPDNRTIKDLYKFTTASYNSCESAIDSKFVFPREIYSYPLYINISFHPCPPGFSISKYPPFKCDCNHLMKQFPGVKCHIQDQTISRSGLVWISTDGNETVAASNCPYNYCNREEINMTLQDPDSQCNFNHSGTLCGGCQSGFSLALGTNQCLHCSNTHLALLLPFALAGVVIVCFIKVIDPHDIPRNTEWTHILCKCS